MTNHVTGRTMLQGMGAALALPWMESLPAFASTAAKAHAAGPDVLLVRAQRRSPADLVSRERGNAC